MTIVTKTVRFDAAHILTHHQGLCKNLHGHTYRVDVTVKQDDDDTRDMVIDFKDLKAAMRTYITDTFDHSFIYDTTSEGECEIAAVLEKQSMRTVKLPCRSTAENLAHHFFNLLAPHIKGLSAVAVWETPDSCATYKR